MAKTGVDKFRFVSPGVQIAEIDNSQLPQIPENIGPGLDRDWETPYIVINT